MTPDVILLSTVRILHQTGRTHGLWEQSGRLCLMAAMAVAADRTPDYWDEVREAEPSEFEAIDHVLIRAARLLARVIPNPPASPDELSVEDLIQVLSGWHDGPLTFQKLDAVYLSPPLNSQVFEALEAASRLAEKAATA